jgi:hypothetical protein
MNHKVPQQPDLKQFKTAAVIVILSIVLVVGLGLFITSNVGQSVNQGNPPNLEPLDLTGDQSSGYRPMLLNVGQSNHFDLVTDISRGQDRLVDTLVVTVSKVSENAMTISVDKGNTNYAFDTLYLSGADGPLRFYVNDLDAEEDLQFSFENGLLTVTNLNFIAPDSATITLLNNEGQVLPRLIRLEPNSTFTANITAEGLAQPSITTRILINGVAVVDLTKSDDELLPPEVDDEGELVDEDAKPTTRAEISWPVVSESVAAILEITATVQDKQKIDYYTLVVGDIAYAQTQHVPKMVLSAPEERDPSLLIMFDNTTELQPLGLPCIVNAQLTDLFQGKPIDRIYTFRNNNPVIWTKNSFDFNNFGQFNGYFVKLAVPAYVNITTTCELDNIQPGVVPGLGDNTQVFEPGWHMISLPGHVPQTLSSFTNNVFTLYECGVGDGNCEEVASDSVLDPGRVYWINAVNKVTLGFR